MSTPTPDNANAALWDQLVLDNTGYAFLVEVDGTAFERKVDARHSAGREGAHLRWKGWPPREFSVTVTCCLPEHFLALDAFVRVIAPQGGDAARRAAYHDIYHPALAQVGITQCVVRRATLLKRSAQGRYEQRFDFIEYSPPRDRSRSATRTPTAAIADRRTAVDQTTGEPRYIGQLTPIPPPSTSNVRPRR
jgi:hypothetical protein